ncbi:MAG: TRL-like protein family [Opitutales bacterium]|nr:TRL-like protein family [Opitutales bacterium]MBP3358230.1 TRL-like family protein [Opitutales bacterium]
MKKYTTLAITSIAMLLLAGCATPIPHGTLFTEVKMPVSASDNVVASKVGTSMCKSYLGLVSVGDASIETAKRNGGITKVTSVDWEVRNVLGFIGEYKCIVRGE